MSKGVPSKFDYIAFDYEMPLTFTLLRNTVGLSISKISYFMGKVMRYFILFGFMFIATACQQFFTPAPSPFAGHDPKKVAEARSKAKKVCAAVHKEARDEAVKASLVESFLGNSPLSSITTGDATAKVPEDKKAEFDECVTEYIYDQLGR